VRICTAYALYATPTCELVRTYVHTYRGVRTISYAPFRGCLMASLDDILGQLGGDRIPGGCDLCDAFQTVEQVEPGIHALTVHHDDRCPFLRSRAAGSN
jgi:hypothetical protein